MTKHVLFLLVFIMMIMAACANVRPMSEPTRVVIVEGEVGLETAVSTPTSTIPPSATPTHTSSPTNTPTATATMTPTPTLIPSPIPSPTTSLWNSLPTPEISFQPEVSLSVVDQVGGAVRAVTVNNGYALIGVGPRLWTIDVSEPAKPIKIGQTDIFPAVVQDVVWADDTAYVATRENGIWVVDMRDAQAPFIAGFFEMPHSVTDLKIQNGRLLALGREIPRGREYDLPYERYLSLIDISEPNNFQVAFTIPIEGAVHSWSWFEDTVFLMKRGLDVINIADPQNPELIQIPEIYERSGVALSDHELYLVGNIGIKEIDISDPGNLVEVDPGESNVFPGYGIADFEIDEQLLFLTGNFCDAGSCGSSLQIHDANETGFPELSFVGAGFLSYDLFVQNGYAYIATEEGLNIVSVCDPYSAKSVSWLPTTGSINDVSVEEDRVGSINSETYSLIFFPLESSERSDNFVSFGPHFADMVEVLLVGDMAYLSTGLGYALGDMRILDVSDIRDPVRIGTFLEERTSGVRETIVQDGFAYMILNDSAREQEDASYNDVFVIVVVSNPGNPYLIGELSFDTGLYKHLAINDEMAYLTNGNQLISISFANPEFPQVIGEIEFNKDVFLQDMKAVPEGLLVIEDRESVYEDELLLIDTTTIDDLRVMSRLLIPDDVHDIAVEHPYAYISGENLWVVDISDPLDLRLVGMSQTPGNLQQVDVQDGIVYAADSEAGLLVLRVDESLQP